MNYITERVFFSMFKIVPLRTPRRSELERERGGSGMRERQLAALTRRFPLTSLTDSTERASNSARTGVLSVGGVVASFALHKSWNSS